MGLCAPSFGTRRGHGTGVAAAPPPGHVPRLRPVRAGSWFDRGHNVVIAMVTAAVEDVDTAGVQPTYRLAANCRGIGCVARAQATGTEMSCPVGLSTTFRRPFDDLSTTFRRPFDAIVKCRVRRPKPSEVTVRADADEKRLDLVVSDDGVGARPRVRVRDLSASRTVSKRWAVSSRSGDRLVGVRHCVPQSLYTNCYDANCARGVEF
jgi:hypothetical protein